jgi:hypothetical protein
MGRNDENLYLHVSMSEVLCMYGRIRSYTSKVERLICMVKISAI